MKLCIIMIGGGGGGGGGGAVNRNPLIQKGK